MPPNPNPNPNPLGDELGPGQRRLAAVVGVAADGRPKLRAWRPACGELEPGARYVALRGGVAADGRPKLLIPSQTSEVAGELLAECRYLARRVGVAADGRPKYGLDAAGCVGGLCTCCTGALPQSYWMTVELPECWGLGASTSFELPLRGRLATGTLGPGCENVITPETLCAKSWPVWLGHDVLPVECCPGSYGEGVAAVSGTESVILAAVVTCCGYDNAGGYVASLVLRVHLCVLLGVGLESAALPISWYQRCYAPAGAFGIRGRIDLGVDPPAVPVFPGGAAFSRCRLCGGGLAELLNFGKEQRWDRVFFGTPLGPPIFPAHCVLVHEQCYEGTPCAELAPMGTLTITRGNAGDNGGGTGQTSCCIEQVGEDEYGNPIYDAPGEFVISWQLST